MKFISHFFWLFCVFVMLFNANSIKEVTGKDLAEPEWVRLKLHKPPAELTPDDYAYLTDWLKNNKKSADVYFIDLFSRYQVVIFGEQHNIKEHKEFIINLIPRLYHEAGVRCIGWEFSRYTDNEELLSLVTAPVFDSDAVLDFARKQFSHDWNSADHWKIIRAIWNLNNSLRPGQEKLRLVGLDINMDFTEFFKVTKTQPADSPEYKRLYSEVLKRDYMMAEHAEKEILSKGIKGLLFVGRCHDFTHYEKIGPRTVMGTLLYKKYGEKVFQVFPGANNFNCIVKIMSSLNHERIGFDVYNSPFATIMSPSYIVDASVPFAQLARGYVYLGPREQLHSNDVIKGFVTQEMFDKYHSYYEIDNDRSFSSAEELDAYFQNNRWPKP